ncbi:myelin basic protein isoform X5 [Esox lucius]|uniref:myelin basic protein isoform X5 n=1 Tax=Esox lucius TaxID=8010 RepID=UPI0014769D52|nr:myelin basic protein isoform X5 [Esox lucius]
MATASTTGQSRRKKAPGLMDQIGTFFGGDKKKRSKVFTLPWPTPASFLKGSFRSHATSPKPAPKRRANENAIVHFFRSLSASSSPRPKSRATPPRADATKSPYRRRKEQGTLSKIFNLW